MMKYVKGLMGLTMMGAMLFSCSSEVKEASYEVIPMPQSIAMNAQGSPFVLADGTKVLYPQGNEQMKKNAEFLVQYVKEQTGKQLIAQEGAEGKGILLQLGQPTEN